MIKFRIFKKKKEYHIYEYYGDIRNKTTLLRKGVTH